MTVRRISRNKNQDEKIKERGDVVVAIACGVVVRLRNFVISAKKKGVLALAR